ncbi:MAG: hypothetical protein R2939_14435 [Kofleriaceae bacterium]
MPLAVNAAGAVAAGEAVGELLVALPAVVGEGDRRGDAGARRHQHAGVGGRGICRRVAEDVVPEDVVGDGQARRGRRGAADVDAERQRAREVVVAHRHVDVAVAGLRLHEEAHQRGGPVDEHVVIDRDVTGPDRDLAEVVLVAAQAVVEPVQPAGEQRVVGHARVGADVLELQRLVAGAQDPVVVHAQPGHQVRRRAAGPAEIEALAGDVVHVGVVHRDVGHRPIGAVAGRVEQADAGEPRARDLEVLELDVGGAADGEAHVQEGRVEGEAVVAEEPVAALAVGVGAAGVAGERGVAGLRELVVAAGEDPVGAAAHRPQVVAGGVVLDPDLAAVVGDDQRPAGLAHRQVAELDVGVAASRDVQAVEGLPVDLGEGGLDVGERQLRALGDEQQRVLGRAPEMPRRIARGHGTGVGTRRGLGGAAAARGQERDRQRGQRAAHREDGSAVSLGGAHGDTDRAGHRRERQVPARVVVRGEHVAVQRPRHQ